MALEFRNKRLTLLVIIVLIASPYIYAESNSQTIPAAFADSSNVPQSVGPNYPGTASGGMWSGLNGVQGGSIGSCASVSGMAGNSRILDLTNFRFNIPSTSIITGVQVGVKVASTNTYAFSAQLLAGGPIGTAKSFTRPGMSTTCASSGMINVSQPSDLWGTSLTADQINSGAFGVEINSGQGGAIRNIDVVSVTVFYYVPDTTPPVIDSHLDVTAEATSSAGATVVYTAPATKDNYDPPGVATCTPASGSTFALGDTKVTCTATDASGNTAIPITFNVHVQDTTAPVISTHLPITMEATSSTGALVTYIAPATHDAVDGDKVAACTPASGTTFALGHNKVTCGITDAAGNAASSSFDVLVQDTTAPAITTNNNIIAEATGSTFAGITANGGVAGGSNGAGFPGITGKQVDITGTSVYYGGGGGGGLNTFGCSGVTDNGGLGGGGHGGFGNSATNSDSCSFAATGTNGLGGGGGGGYFSPSANGGSGVVIISYNSGKITATGGVISTLGGKTIHTFTSNGVFTVTNGSAKIKILVVGGGGGGSGHGGGNGGDINYIDNYFVSPNTFTITIGAGGIHDLSTGGGISAFTPVVTTAPNLGGSTAVSFTAPTATDTVSTPTVTCDHASGSVFALGHTKVTCTATDAASNSASSFFDVFIQDTTAPVITKNTDIVAEATSSAGATVTFTAPTATDLVSIPTVTCAPSSGSTFALGHTKVTCTATDAAGNSASSSFDVFVHDTTAPTITKNADITAEATSSAGAAVTFTAPATKDNYDPPGVATCTPASGSTFALGDTIVTCTAKDAAGNSATPTTFKVHVQDTTAPVIDSHNPIIAEATSSTGAVVTYMAPATHDVFDGGKTATCTPASGSTFALGDTIVTCTAKDAAGNSATPTTFKVHVQDTTAPTIASHDPVIMEATGPSGAVVTYTAPATHDAVDGDKVTTCTPVSGSTFAIADTKITCTATDAAGNSASSSFDVIVRQTTPSTIAPSNDITAEATSSAGATVTYNTPSATDIVSTPTVTCTPISGSTFPLGNTKITCTAINSAGISSSAFFYVMVHDTTAPTITTNIDITTEATSSAGAAVTYTTPTATDTVSTPTVTCDHASGSVFALGHTKVTCTATDLASNSASSSFDVFVQDTTAPTIAKNTDIVAEETSSAGAAVTFTAPTATDTVSSPTVTCDHASGSVFALGHTKVTCNAKDIAGNSASSSFDVFVHDTTAPTIDSHDPITMEASAPSGSVVTYTSPATHDAVDGDKVATCTPASGSTFALGDTKVTCSITDIAGNSASSSFDVFVQDTTAPAITKNTDITVEATSSAGAVVTFTAPTATDAVSTPTITCDHASGSTFALGHTKVTCNAKDTAGNSASSSFDVLVQDTTVPAITTNKDITAEATNSAGAAVTYTAPTATDAVSTPTVTCDHASGSTFALGDTEVECTATDTSGNSASSFFYLMVKDTTAPTITTNKDITAEATSSAGAAVTYTAPTATDAVSTPTVTCDHDSGSIFALDHTKVTCTATDIAGNSASSSFDVFVQDTTAPTITPNNDVVAEATSSAGASVEYTTPIATDAVSSPAITCSPYSGSTFALGNTTVTCDVTDAASNSASSSFNVLVQDTTAPVIDSHDAVNMKATGPSGAVVTYTAPATHDAVDGNKTATCTPASGSTFALGDTKVTCSITDIAGNSASSSFDIIVQDATAPVIDSHVPITMEATDSSGAAVTYTAPATHDDVDPAGVASCTPTSGSIFPLGDTQVTCTAKDTSGNSALSFFDVTVQDTTAPVITSHTTVTAEATSSSGAAVTFTAPTATDAVSSPAVVCNYDSGSIFGLGDTKVECTATDLAGNSASSFFDVIVQDTTAPSIAKNTDITAEATSSAGATVTFTAPTATDAVSSPTVTCDHASGSTFALGHTKVTCNAKDIAGNSASSSFDVFVQDTTAPTISPLSDIAMAAPTSSGIAVTYTAPTATDSVSIPTVTCTPASGSTFVVGNTIVTCTAKDAAGNSASTSFNVIITLVPPDHAPTGTAPAVTTPQNTAVTGTMTVADVDGDPLTVTVGTTPAHGTATIIDNSHFRYTPAANYAGSDTFKLDVSDGKLDTFFDASITVTAVNHAPTGSAPAVTTTENTAVTGTMTVSDVDGNVLTVTVSTPPGHGTVSIIDNSHFKYTPSPNYIGSDKFTLQVSDGKLSNTFDVSVTVKDVIPPEALIQFDPVTKTLQVFGTDDSFGRSSALSPSSTTTNSDGSKLNTYKISDPSGNSLTVVEKFTTGTNALTTSMVSVKYNNGAVTTVAENQQKFSWTLKSRGSINTLSQEMYLGPNWVTQEVSIDYDSATKISTVALEQLNPVQTSTFSGLVLERMTTSNGDLWISY